MGIQEIVAALASSGPKNVDRAPAGGGDQGGGSTSRESDTVAVSEQAKTRFEAGQGMKYDAIRERIRLGYYMKKDVVDQVVSALAREMAN